MARDVGFDTPKACLTRLLVMKGGHRDAQAPNPTLEVDVYCYVREGHGHGGMRAVAPTRLVQLVQRRSVSGLVQMLALVLVPGRLLFTSGGAHVGRGQ